MRLDGIENSIEILNGRTKYLEERMDNLIDNVKQNNNISSGSQMSPNPPKKGSGYVKQGRFYSDYLAEFSPHTHVPVPSQEPVAQWWLLFC